MLMARMERLSTWDNRAESDKDELKFRLKHSWAGWKALFAPAIFLAWLGLSVEPAHGASQLTFTVGNVSGQPGAQVLVPVRASAFANINSFQFTVHWTTTSAAF